MAAAKFHCPGEKIELWPESHSVLWHHRVRHDGALSPQTVGGRMVRSIAFGVALILGAGSIATAQTADEQALCKDDAFRVCSHTIPDRDRTFQCMVANKDSLSPGCRTVMARLLPPDPPPQKSTTQRRRTALSKPATTDPAAEKPATSRSRKGPINLNPPGR